MANKNRRLYVRITEDEREKALALADSLSLTMSDLIRALLQLPAGYVEGTESRPVLVIDSKSAFRLARETRWWGYQYNQITHALNRIAYFLRRDMADIDDVMEELKIVEEKVNKANDHIAVLSAEAQRMAAMFKVRR